MPTKYPPPGTRGGVQPFRYPYILHQSSTSGSLGRTSSSAECVWAPSSAFGGGVGGGMSSSSSRLFARHLDQWAGKGADASQGGEYGARDPRVDLCSNPPGSPRPSLPAGTSTHLHNCWWNLQRRERKRGCRRIWGERPGPAPPPHSRIAPRSPGAVLHRAAAEAVEGGPGPSCDRGHPRTLMVGSRSRSPLLSRPHPPAPSRGSMGGSVPGGGGECPHGGALQPATFRGHGMRLGW